MATKAKSKSPSKSGAKQGGLKKLVAGAKKIADNLGRGAKPKSAPPNKSSARKSGAAKSAAGKPATAKPAKKTKTKAKASESRTPGKAAAAKPAAKRAAAKKGKTTATKGTGRGKAKPGEKGAAAKSPKGAKSTGTSKKTEKPDRGTMSSKREAAAATPKSSGAPDYGAVKDVLLGMRRDILGDLASEPLRDSEGARGGGDIYDQASDERDREFLLLMSERERSKLAAIDDALSRIKDGSYGECEGCGELIPIGRLKVMPFAIYCVDCQSQAEQDAKREAFYGEGINAFGGLDSDSEAEG